MWSLADIVGWFLANPGWSAIIFGAIFLSVLTAWPFKWGKAHVPVKWASGVLSTVFLAVFVVMSVFVSPLAAVGGAQTPPGDVSLGGCGDVTSTTEGITIRNVADSSLSYAGNTYYFQNAATGELEETGSAASSGTAVTETLNPCTAYEIKTLTNRGATGVARAQLGASLEFTTGKVGTTHQLDAYNLSNIQVTVLDLQTAFDAEHLYEDGSTGGDANQTAYTVLNTTSVQEDAAATAVAVAADGYINYEINFKSVTSNTYGTDPNTKWWMCIDEGADGEWQEPIVSGSSGKLVDNKDGIDSDSKKGTLVSAADWCYQMPKAIDDAGDKVTLYMKADSGQNPDTSNDDVTVSFLAEGTYVSAKAANSIKTGIYTDASTPALVVYDSTRAPSLIFQIS